MIRLPGQALIVIAAVLLLLPAPAGAQDTPPYKSRAVTQGPLHHFFGYYDITPWDKTGRYLLANEIGFIGRQPKKDEPLTVGVVDLKTGKYTAFDKTFAWCWQMGTRLQWLGSAPDREVIYNSIDPKNEHYVCIVRDIHTGKTRTLPRAVYALSPDGSKAVSLDFDRLHRTRPGYGYQALPEKDADERAPKNRGIYLMDMKTGDDKLILSLDWAAHNKTDERFHAKAHHWFNHLLFSPSGEYFIFLHRWQKITSGGWWTRMYVARADGTEPTLVFDDGMVSHFDWRDDDTILAWARTREHGDHFYIANWKTGKREIFGEKILKRDGHCAYSPDRRWILNDTYPDADRLQTLMILDPRKSKRIELGKYFSPRILTGPPRCDLHPRWRRDGKAVCFDSGHLGTRQVFVVDLK